MKKLHKQMKELVKCQGEQTREYVEAKLKNFMDGEEINISELLHTLEELKQAIASDENTFKLIDGMVETNKNKLSIINNTIIEIRDDIKSINEDNILINRRLKECLRIQEEDMVINVSELCVIFGNALNDAKIDDTL
jgi:septation ring formation regulator EzrA